MDVQSGDDADEIKRLQRCINDLVGLLALPAMWSGGEPSQIIYASLDALLRMLELDLVYVRFREGAASRLSRCFGTRNRKSKALGR